MSQIQVGSFNIQYFAFENFDETVSHSIDTIQSDDDAPLYGTLWPAARTLLDELNEMELNNKKVLELGCGLGIPSILCALKGAHAIASDFHPEVREYVEHNSQLNNCVVEFQQIDWRKTTASLEADLIIGSDILYEPKIFPDLVKFIKGQASPACQILITDPIRVSSDQFIKELTKQKLIVNIDRKKDHQVLKISTR